MKLIVAGGRDFTNYEWMSKAIEAVLDTHPIDMIISGGAPGADELAELWCLESIFPLQVFEADWEKYGRAAGPIRNREMAKAGDVLLCFWDGKSKGTKSMINEARREQLLDIHILYYGKEIPEPQSSIN